MAEDKELKKQKEIQKRYIEYQMAEQQIRQMQQQLEKLEAQTSEVAAVEQSIEDIAKAKAGDEVLVPVSGGIFFNANVGGSGTFLVNVGSGVVVEKDLEGTKGLIKDQSRELDKFKDHVVQQIAEHITRYQELEIELKKLIED
ncbi:prefoldin subunit alpha [Candidatus Woesearchaeota archaeon]|nr:prefoldin subunit alpha [Candidatus Woesearchaeota archaeon]